MRISRIRLAGFKSFVDPTTLNLPGNLTGVVGPNGCGKSNVIDAVLWVMGESSAKHLRGDSMADVIFNGSATRKPIGQAAVEIIFDNSDGLIGGQYASYSEISIKRTVTRDGISSYYLNGVRCRRLDITNLFLGTGIGSRSYSVIEQGMISRVVEARPEDLRLFLEEAAGISKYKARRKDTEHRIQNCRENLSRLDDIRLELEKQLNHLQQQAKAAERYQELKTEERHLHARMLALRWRDLLALEREAKHEAEIRATRVEAATAVLRATESQLAQARGAHGAAGDGFSTVQREYYSVGATIARLEQALQHVAELKLRQERDIDEARRGLAEARASESRDAAEIARLGGELAQIAPETERFAAAESTGASRLTQSEGEFHAWQGEWDTFQQRSADTTRRAEVSRTRLEHLEDSLSDLTERLAGLRDERVRLRAQIEGRRTEELRATVHAQRSRLEQLTGEQDGRQARLRDLRARAQELARHLDAQRSEAHELRGRLASLEALQQAAFGADQPEVVDWLGRAGFASQPRLAQRITVEEGWEWPLEVVLGIPLDAVSVDVLDSFLDWLPQLRGGVVSAVETRQAVAAERKSRSVLDVPTLGERLGPDSGMDQLLATIYTVETLNDARALVPRLQPWESVVTRDGTWLGHGWVQVRHGRAAHEGILERERALRGHKAGLDALLQAISDREAGLRSVDDEIRDVESALASAEPHVHEARERVTEESARLAAHIAEREQNERRLAVLEDDIHALEEQHATHGGEHQSISDEIETLVNGADDLEEERERLVTRRDMLRDAVQAARESWREVREASHAVALRAESLRLSLHAGEQALARNRAIAAQAEERIAALAAALEAGMPPQRQLRSDLDAALATQLRVEQDLVAARTELQGVEARIRELEQQRAAEDQEVLVQRESWESARVDLRAAEVRIADLKEQIAEHGLAEQALPADLPAEATEASIHEEIERVARRVQRLGPINLAAIGEFAQLSERKGYLDAQYADLTAALTTLEEAIHKIDRETRTRFKETFDKVNAGLQGKFPLLFGGGHAYLELTGEDLLETGVTVMARPPGKRNGTIHLLSGGEKALTAVALIFAIFDLNPAPFCLLDEVDAPLDDANVVRLCELLKSMGDRIQFVFITHNKITMEIAGQLIGVTMQEPGVSRLVAVDMDEAVQLAATG